MPLLRSLSAFLIEDWRRVLLYAILIILCVILAPEAALKFIYTEF